MINQAVPKFTLPAETTLKKLHWNSVGPNGNKGVLICSGIDINGVSCSLYGIRVYDPEITDICPPGTLTWEHYEAYGPILWNIEHGEQYFEECLRSDEDNKPIPNPPPYLRTTKFNAMEDWLDSLLVTYKSDYTLTPPRIVVHEQPYILAMIPVSEESGEISSSIELNPNSWMPYASAPGYQETLIEVDGHLIKIKAFEVLERKKNQFKTTLYSTGDETIIDYLEQHKYIIQGRNKFRDDQKTPVPVHIGRHNYLLFGISANREEEQQRYDKYHKEQEASKILPQGIIEYHIGEQIPEDWGKLIEFMAAEILENHNISVGNIYNLDLQKLEKTDIELPTKQNLLSWLNNTTKTVLYRSAQWYKKADNDELEINPEKFDLSLEWYLEGNTYKTKIDPITKQLLSNMEKGAAERATITSDPLQIIIEPLNSPPSGN